MSRLLVLLSLFYLATAEPWLFSEKITRFAEKKFGYRLPNNTFPLRYDLTLTSHIHLDESHSDDERFAFQGHVFIHLSAKEATDFITLQQYDLDILTAELTEEGAEEPVQTWEGRDLEYEEEFDFLTFQLSSPLEPRKVYVLEITYEGELVDGEYGFYRSTYTDPKTGEKRWLATTQFEATDARQAFPCYDEPGVRAPIGLSIVHGSSYFALANTPVKSQEPALQGYTKTSFQDTPVMQTYILCFVISDFTYVEVHSSTPQRVFAPQHDIESGHADFSVRVGVNVLEYLNGYFGVNYSDFNVKIDQIAIPDFAAGAMENWGLVTYAEPYLLFDEKHDTTDDKHDIAATIAHEYTHQFFGNLVSPKWWDYLWLNEGFATLYEYLALTPIYPEFNPDEMFQVRTLQRVLETDGFGLTRAMTEYVEDPEDIDNLFDAVAYPKSGSVLYTLRNALSDSTWRKGLRYYLNDMKLKAATSKDLSRNLQRAVNEDGVSLSGLTMDQIVEAWSRTPGYPVLHVAVDDLFLHLNQSEFQYLQERPRDNGSPVWPLPITVASATQPDFNQSRAQFWTNEASSVAVRAGSVNWKPDDWIIVNVNQAGYYRVNYEAKIWDALISKLQSPTFDEIPAASRSQLLDDAFHLARADLLDYRTLFRLMQFLHHETHFVPWTSADRGLTYMLRLLQGSPAGSLFQRYVRHLTKDLYEHYGLKDLGSSETFGAKQARLLGIRWACKSGNEECREETRKLVLDALKGNRSVSLDTQDSVYCAASRTFETDEFLALWNLLETVESGWHRLRIIQGLGCSESPETQTLYLNTTLQAGVTYSSLEGYYVLNSVYLNSVEGLETSMAFLESHAEEFSKKYGRVSLHAQGMARLISSDAHLKTYTELLQTLRGLNIISADSQASFLRIANLNLKWQEDYGSEIEAFLTDFFSVNSARLPVTSGLLVCALVALKCFF